MSNMSFTEGPYLPNDVINEIGKYLEEKDYLALTSTDKSSSTLRNKAIRSLYEKTFGPTTAALSSEAIHMMAYSIGSIFKPVDTKIDPSKLVDIFQKTHPESIMQIKNRHEAYKHQQVILGKDKIQDVEKTHAVIGKVLLNDKHYEVIAEQKPYGNVWIRIMDPEDPDKNYSFLISIAREEKIEGRSNDYVPRSGELFSEIHSGKPPVWNKRHLLFGSSIWFEGPGNDPKGSDRLFDQKLVQILIEMTMQNKDIISVLGSSGHSSLAIFSAAGFKSRLDILPSILEFRSDQENHLFPPYTNYGGDDVAFALADVNKKNVYFSRGEPESWAEIIAREPILKPGAGILPEFWDKEPQIVAEDS